MTSHIKADNKTHGLLSRHGAKAEGVEQQAEEESIH